MGDTHFHYDHKILILHTYHKGFIEKHTSINNIMTFSKTMILIPSIIKEEAFYIFPYQASQAPLILMVKEVSPLSP